MTQTTALLVSIALEVPLLLAVAWRSGDRRSLRWLLVGTLATCLTHPVVWHGIPATRPWIGPWAVRAVLFESFAVIVEGVVFVRVMDWPTSRALALATLANITSFGLGLAWFWLS